MKVPAVMYKGHIYTAPTGHVDALARLVANHYSPNADTIIDVDDWLAVNLPIIRYGWLVNKQFEERQ